jgi:hypothetical protein
MISKVDTHNDNVALVDIQNWLTLSQIAGLGNAGLCQLLAKFGTPDAIFNASKTQLAEIVSSEIANREAGETQQRQVTETIVREMPKINRNDTVTIQNVANGQTQEMKFKKAESLIANGTWVLVN